MLKRFEGRTVLITGAVGALGVAMVHDFAAEGANVVVAARKKTEGSALAESLGTNGKYVQLDVTREESWQAALSETERYFGPISVLINNAAYLSVGSIETISLSEWQKVLDTNLTGPFLGIKVIAPSMRKLGGGSIVNVSSIAGLHATPKDRIRVNAVHPGIIDTPLAYDSATGKELVPVEHFAVPRMASATEISKYILFVASEDAAFSTASEFLADGGFGLGPIV